MNQNPDDLRAARRREFLQTARKLREEKESSAGVVARYLRSTPVEEWPRLAEVREMQNSAALEQLSEEVRRLLDREPHQALAVSDLATVIAESLPAGCYPETILAQLRATAWKDRANSLRYLARYPEAAEAVSRAEDLLAPHPALAYDRAVVRLVEAMIAHQIGDTESAYSLLRNCRAVFDSYGDRARANMAGLIEGNFLFDGEKFEEARTVFSSLLPTAADIETKARLHNNLGYCDTYLGEFTSANIHFSEAIAKFNDLGFESEALRTRRGAAALLIAKGQKRAGMSHLSIVRETYTRCGMLHEATLCGLEIVELLVDSGDIADARSLAREISAAFSKTHVSTRTAEALARLDEAISQGGPAAALQVRNVHAFFEQEEHRTA